MASTTPDIKEQIAEARRTQILLGAAQVFAEKGFHRATTKEIAKAAGISEGTIYNYFDTKRALLVAMIELLAIASLKTLITDHPPEEPADLLKVIMHDRYRLAQERGHLLAPIAAEVFTDEEVREELYQQIIIPISAHLEQFIQKRVDSGQFRPVDPVVVTRAMVGAIVVNFALKLTGTEARYDDISPDSLIDQLVSLFLHGLVAEESNSV
jgi:AcrR family transcriptional regulator